MGKSRHPSCSSRTKANVKFSDKKNKKNNGRGKYEKKDDRDCGNCENEEKEKNYFWKRWVNFFRRRWSEKKIKNIDGLKNPVDPKSIPDITEKNKIDDDQLHPAASTVNSTEIPIDLKQKISKIFIKPAKNGIQAMIAQCDGTKIFPPRTEEDSLAKSNRGKCHSDRGRIVENRLLGENNGEMAKRRWSWEREGIQKQQKTIKRSENSLTSALYIRKDLDNVVESTVFIEPNLSSNLRSKPSENFSQNSTGFSQKRISCSLPDPEDDVIMETFKTVSEPTWEEREKIFNHQKLQDNINELLEQFIFLESEDLINFRIHQSKAIKESKRLIFDDRISHNSSLETNREHLMRDLSREVSPEILVNIKPFKEYLSDDSANLEEDLRKMTSRKGKKERGVDKYDTRVIKESQTQKKQRPGKSKKERDEKKSPSPVVNNENETPERKSSKSSVKELKETEPSKPEVTNVAVLPSNSKISDTQIESVSNSIQASTEMIFTTSTTDIQSMNPGVCAVWGIYKTYGTEKFFQRSLNLDEVLENLDDRDHDLIFKKNMTQFRKKINSKPRYDIKRPNPSMSKILEVEQEKLTQHESPSSEMLDTIEENNTEAVSEEVSSREKKEKYVEKLIIENVPDINERKLEKITRSNSCLLSANFVRTVLGYRIEAMAARTVQIPRTFRTLCSLVQSNGYVAAEKEPDKSDFDCLQTVEIVRMQDVKETKSMDNKFMFRFNFNDVAKLIGFERNELISDLLTRKESTETKVGIGVASDFITPKYLSTPMECYYVLENYLYTNFEGKGLLLSENPSGDIVDENANKIEIADFNDEPQCSKLKTFYTKMEQFFLKKKLKTIEIVDAAPTEFLLYLYSNTNHHLLTKPKIKPLSDTTVAKKGVFKARVFYSNSELHVVNNTKTAEHQPPHSNAEEKISTGSFKGSKLVVTTDDELNTGNDVAKTEERTEIQSEETSDGIDGFEIIYDGSDKRSEDEVLEESLKGDSLKNLTITRSSRQRPSPFVVSENSVPHLKRLEGFRWTAASEGSGFSNEEKKKDKQPIEKIVEIRKSKSFEKKIATRLLKFKSNSSPKENILQSDYMPPEHRLRRSSNFVKEMEKLDFHNCKKKRISVDKGIEVRRTGSAFLETRNRLGADRPLLNPSQNKEIIGEETKLRSQLLTEELKLLTRSEYRVLPEKDGCPLGIAKLIIMEKPGVKLSDTNSTEENKDKTKMLLVERNGSGVKKEIVAAFNSIKELSPSRDEVVGGNKKMSLVIMLSKK